LILGLIFSTAPSFFRPAEQEIDAAIGIGVAVALEMEFRHKPETQADAQFVTQIMPGMIQRAEGLFLLPFVAFHSDFDMHMPPVGAYVDLGDIHVQHPWVLHFEGNDLGQFLANGLGNPQCAPLIHK